MKRAIIVKGNPNVGKSTILIEVYFWIKSNYLPVVFHEEIYYKVRGNPASGISDVYSIMHIGKLRIGFSSGGDESLDVLDFIAICKQEDCDIIVGACRAIGGTFNTVRAELKYPDYVTDWCIPEWCAPATNMTLRVSVGVAELKARLTALPKL